MKGACCLLQGEEMLNLLLQQVVVFMQGVGQIKRELQTILQPRG